MKTRLTAIAGVVAAGALLAACSDPTSSGSGSDSDTIVVGSADFPESEIVAEIYAQALEAKDVKVEKKLRIGARERYIPALENGEIDLVPDYTGNLLTYADKDATAKTADEIDDALDDALPDSIEALDPAPAEDKDSLNVTKETADQYGLASIADLSKVKPLRLGAPAEFETRRDGLPGLEREYGLSGVKFTGTSGSTAALLTQGKVDVANVFTTDPQIEAEGLVTLEDPKNLFLPQNVVPVINDKKSTDEIEDTLDAVSAKLTTEGLAALNAENQGDDKTSASVVAKQWLEDNGFL